MKWVNLGQIEIQQALGTGSVTSKSVIPNRYKAYTFGVKDSDADLYVDSQDIEPFNPCVPDSSSQSCLNRVCVEVDLKVFLEGALTTFGLNNYNDTMRSSLKQYGYLPGQKPTTLFGVATDAGQPYAIDPWRYDGNEGKNINEFVPPSATNRYPSNNIVDWVLVSLRTSQDASSTTCTKPALLTTQGNIIFTDFFDCCDIATSSYYVVIQHRNHLPVMTPSPIPISEGVISYDFTKNQSFIRLLGNGQKEVKPGVFAMFAGNGDQALALESPKDINANDISLWARDNGRHSGYYSQDYNLNGDVNVQDKAIWLENNGIFTDVDIR
jgi:hypothetical protein